MWTVCGCSVAAVVGHCYSPYLRFAGGKAVATGLGVLLAFNWAAGLICFAVWIVLTAVTRYVSLASMVAYGTAPGVAWALGDSLPPIITFGLLALLSVYRHRDNVRRLLAGTETKIGRSKPADGIQAQQTGEDQPEGGEET